MSSGGEGSGDVTGAEGSGVSGVSGGEEPNHW